MPGYENFAGWEKYQNILDEAGYYSAPRFVFSGTLFSTDGSAPILFNAVEPIAEAKVLRYASYIETGRYIENGAFEIALGALVAKKLKIDIESGQNNVMISATIDIKDENGKVRHVYQVIAAALTPLPEELEVFTWHYPMVKYGLDLSAMRETMGADASFRVASLFRSTWDISALMAFFPVRRAVKMPITDSLRFE